MLNRRVQILFDKDLWNKLVKHAKAQNISAGEVVRRGVKDQLNKKEGPTIDKTEPENKPKSTPFNRLFKSRSKT